MHIPIPPEELQAALGRTATASAYLEVGRVVKEDTILCTGLQRTGSVLDVGCGSGRMARHFVDYVETPGRYVGTDVNRAMVGWCEEHIAPLNPAFSFLHQDVHNGLYNPAGTVLASEYRFPFEDGSFDAILLASVFTHLLPDDAEHYLEEVARLLGPDGVCFSTWLLLGHDAGVAYTGIKTPEGQVRYGFPRLLEMMERCGLAFSRDPVPKRWADDEHSPFRIQDLVLLRKARPGENPAKRYAVPETPSGETRETRGTVRFFDPVRNALTLLDRDGTRAFRVARDADITVNGLAASTPDFREGQRASVRFASDPSGENVASEVSVSDVPQEATSAGLVEVVDPERGCWSSARAGGSSRSRWTDAPSCGPTENPPSSPGCAWASGSASSTSRGRRRSGLGTPAPGSIPTVVGPVSRPSGGTGRARCPCPSGPSSRRAPGPPQSLLQRIAVWLSHTASAVRNAYSEEQHKRS